MSDSSVPSCSTRRGNRVRRWSTTTLVEQGGRTTLTSTMLYVFAETRDNVLKSGMERGVAASLRPA